MKAHGIVLAAGAGRRFGGGKLLAQFNGRPLVAWAVEAALRSKVGGVTVVIAPDGETVGEAAKTTAEGSGEGARLSLAVASDAAEGMGASLRAGVAAAPVDAALVVLLADMPRIPPAIIARLLEAVEQGAPAAAPTSNGRRGHPVVFAPVLRGALLRVQGDAGAREVLASLANDVALIAAADEGVLFDIDTIEDLQRG